jgi:hypothetical protein
MTSLYDVCRNGGYDGFVAQLSSSGSWTSLALYGGTGDDYLWGMAVSQVSDGLIKRKYSNTSLSSHLYI